MCKRAQPETFFLQFLPARNIIHLKSFDGVTHSQSLTMDDNMDSPLKPLSEILWFDVKQLGNTG
jgi:hypothetical protein